MKNAAMVLMLGMLAACGVETASTAASSSALKKQELEQGRATMDKMQRDLDEVAKQAAQRAAQADEGKWPSTAANGLTAGEAKFAGAFHLLYESREVEAELGAQFLGVVVQPAPARREVVFLEGVKDVVAVVRHRDDDDLIVENVHDLADQAGITFLFAGQVDDQHTIAGQFGVGVLKKCTGGQAGGEAGPVEGIDQ